MNTFLLALALIVAMAAPAAATSQDIANEVPREIMSPYCDGVTLHDCPSQAAADLRARIRKWAERGWTKAEIIGELEDRYGERIHATPQNSEGLGAWALPALALLAGIAGIALLATRWARRSDEDLSPVPSADHARVERELAALRKETS